MLSFCALALSLIGPRSAAQPSLKVAVQYGFHDRWNGTTSNFTFVRSSSDINFEQIEPLQLHVVGASSAALADLRGRQAQHVSERGLMSRAGQVRRAWVPGRDCAAQRILSVHGALGEHLNRRRRKRAQTHSRTQFVDFRLASFPT